MTPGQQSEENGQLCWSCGSVVFSFIAFFDYVSSRRDVCQVIRSGYMGNRSHSQERDLASLSSVLLPDEAGCLCVGVLEELELLSLSHSLRDSGNLFYTLLIIFCKGELPRRKFSYCWSLKSLFVFLLTSRSLFIFFLEFVSACLSRSPLSLTSSSLVIAPSNSLFSSVVVPHTCQSGTWKTKAGRAWVPGHPGLHSETLS